MISLLSVWFQLELNIWNYHQISNIRHAFVGNLSYWSLRCSWNIACWHCSNYIFILDLTHGFYIVNKGNCKTRRETFKFWDSVQLILEFWQYVERWSLLRPSISQSLGHHLLKVLSHNNGLNEQLSNGKKNVRWWNNCIRWLSSGLKPPRMGHYLICASFDFLSGGCL